MLNTNFDENELSWQKMKGLIPAVVQDNQSKEILMLGYMTKEALAKTLETRKVTFFSRSKNKLWTKGETSGHYLEVCDIRADCDQDCIVVKAQALGPTCHLGNVSCFETKEEYPNNFISSLEKIINTRKNVDPKKSYTASLFTAGLFRMAQKVGEEGLEVALASVSTCKQKLCEESADLLFHLLVLLSAKGLSFNDVIRELRLRGHKKDDNN